MAALTGPRTQARHNRCSYEDGSGGRSEKWAHSGWVPNIELTGFAMGSM